MNKFVFALHRGGSSVLGGVAKACALASGETPQVLGSTPKAFRETGPSGAARRVRLEGEGDGGDPMDTARFEPQPEHWAAREGVFAPIRRADFFPVERFGAGDLALFNVRDPRDCMVSAYFGFLRLHGRGLADENRRAQYEAGVDAYVLNQMLGRYADNLDRYIALQAAIPSLKVMHYETMVTDFDAWFRAFYEHLRFAPEKFDALLTQQGAKFAPPQQEDIDAHKRQMLPGDYLRKLKPATIATVNERLARQLEHFGYA